MQQSQTPPKKNNLTKIDINSSKLPPMLPKIQIAAQPQRHLHYKETTPHVEDAPNQRRRQNNKLEHEGGSEMPKNETNQL